MRSLVAVVADMGGTVILGSEHENLCRRATPEEIGAGAHDWIVESQGLPNLLHEVVHALFLGELADDHGFDYGSIPLNLRDAGHRAILWEELACCALSTLYAAPFAEDPRVFARDWFAEQFEIQGVFHGLEHDLTGFRARIDAQLTDPEGTAEARATFARGRGLLEAALLAHGAPPAVARPVQSIDIEGLWADYRLGWKSSNG
ncbi:MAG: hypothetical protein KC431_03905 [Myxococcales bacterium]|nr:hypothetical protein [Myxococcales bacterium]